MIKEKFEQWLYSSVLTGYNQYLYPTVSGKPKKRHSSNLIADLKREKMENANAHGLASSDRLAADNKIVLYKLITGLKMRIK